MEPLESLFLFYVLLAKESEFYYIDLQEFGNRGNCVYILSDCCLSLKRVAANKQLENLMYGDILTLQIRQGSTEFTTHFIF